MDELEIKQIIKQALNKGYEYFSKGDTKNAQEIYQQILRVDPDSLDATQMVIICATRNHDFETALKHAEIGMKTADVNVWNNIGLLHSTMGHHEKAMYCFRRASSYAPDQVHLYTNLAIEYKKIGDIDQAIKIFRCAAHKNPKNEHVWFNYAAFLHELGDLEKAEFLYRKAIHFNENFPVAHYNLSACLFLQNKWQEAWTEYEWRWQYFKHFAKVRDRFKGPYWNGEPCNKLLVYTEQGIGDMIMFIRYLPLIKSKVVVECQPDLKSLLDADMWDGEETDAHCSLLSIPRILGTMPDNVPPPYQFKPTPVTNPGFWDQFKEFKVGIAWAGSPIHPNDKNRSLKLSQFGILANLPNVKLFSLQKEHVCRLDGTDLNEGVWFKVVDFHEYMVDWNCTAEIVKNMDLIITVDTAVAHLAASLGKPTWLLLPRVPDWRWGMTGEKTAWYPTMRLFRNKDEWAVTLASVRKELLHLLSERTDMIIANKEDATKPSEQG